MPETYQAIDVMFQRPLGQITVENDKVLDYEPEGEDGEMLLSGFKQASTREGFMATRGTWRTLAFVKPAQDEEDVDE